MQADHSANECQTEATAKGALLIPDPLKRLYRALTFVGSDARAIVLDDQHSALVPRLVSDADSHPPTRGYIFQCVLDQIGHQLCEQLTVADDSDRSRSVNLQFESKRFRFGQEEVGQFVGEFGDVHEFGGRDHATRFRLRDLQ